MVEKNIIKAFKEQVKEELGSDIPDDVFGYIESTLLLLRAARKTAQMIELKTIDESIELTSAFLRDIKDDIEKECTPIDSTVYDDPEVEDHKVEEKEKFDFCPVCGEKFTIQCKCPLSERTCPNKHTWFKCLKHKEIIVGKADHSKDIMDCRCEDGIIIE